MHSFLGWLWLSLLASQSAQADALPLALAQSQALLVSQGTCEAGWRELGGGPRQYPLGEGVILWLVPCAEWSVNLESAVYLELPAEGDKDLFRPVLFLDYDPYQGLHAGMVSYNVRFDANTQSLYSYQYFLADGACASSARYDWSPGPQRFQAVKILKNDVCQGGERWEQVWPPVSAGAARSKQPGF